jgi:hypothetical protein
MDGVFRLAYGNIDGFPTVPFNNPKANVLKHWLRDIEAYFLRAKRSENQLEFNALFGITHRDLQE